MFNLEPAEPVVLVEDGDIQVFQTLEALVGHVEAIDVRDGIYEACDAVGRPIHLTAATDRGPVTCTLSGEPEPTTLRGLLLRYAKGLPAGRLGLTGDDLDGASLDRLLTVLLPRPRNRHRRHLW